MGTELLMLGLDGIMFDTEDAHLWSFNAAFKNCELDLRWSMPQLRKAMQKWGVMNAVAELDGLSNYASRSDITRLVTEKNRLFHELILTTKLTPHPACVRLMQEMLDNGGKLAVVAELPAPTTTLLLEQAFNDKFHGMFSVVLSEARFNTPTDNGPHSLVLRTAGVDATSCIAIEAFSPGMRSAQQAGVWTVVTSADEEAANVIRGDLLCPAFRLPKSMRADKVKRDMTSNHFITLSVLEGLKHQHESSLPTTRMLSQARASA